jgi:tetratricopeptide (TPR) repeat protein
MTPSPIMRSQRWTLQRLLPVPFYVVAIWWLVLNASLGGHVGFHPWAVILTVMGCSQERAKGHLAQAEDLYRGALKCYAGNVTDDTFYAVIARHLAAVLNKQGRAGEAEPYYKKALEIRTKIFGHESRWTARSLGDLASFYRDQGRPTEATPLAEEVVSIVRQLRGSHSIATADALVRLGLIYQDKGDHCLAGPLFQEALAIDRERRGEYSSRTALTKVLLAISYANQGNRLAEPLMIESVRIANQECTKKKKNYWVYAYQVAVLSGYYGHFADAERLFDESLKIAKEKKGAESIESIRILQSWAETRCCQGRFLEAEPMATQILRLRMTTLGPQNAETARTVELLGWIYEGTDRPGPAKMMYDQALRVRTATLGPEHGLTLESRFSLNRALRPAGWQGSD